MEPASEIFIGLLKNAMAFMNLGPLVFSPEVLAGMLEPNGPVKDRVNRTGKSQKGQIPDQVCGPTGRIWFVDPWLSGRKLEGRKCVEISHFHNFFMALSHGLY